MVRHRDEREGVRKEKMTREREVEVGDKYLLKEKMPKGLKPKSIRIQQRTFLEPHRCTHPSHQGDCLSEFPPKLLENQLVLGLKSTKWIKGPRGPIFGILRFCFPVLCSIMHQAMFAKYLYFHSIFTP